MASPQINEFSRPPVYDIPAGAAQAEAVLRGDKPKPPPPERTREQREQ